MSTAQSDAEDHALAFCEEIFKREMKIGEGDVKSGNALSLNISAPALITYLFRY